MTDKPCSEIAKEIVNSKELTGCQAMLHPPVTFYKPVIIEAIADSLQTERTAREAAKDRENLAHQKAERLESEVERLKDLRKSYPTDHSAEEINALRSKVEELQLALKTEKDKPCPFVVTSDEGTSYCKLAESKALPNDGEEHSCGKSRRLVETLKEKDAEIGRLRERESLISKARDHNRALADDWQKDNDTKENQIKNQYAQLQAQAEVIKAVSSLLRKIEVCSYIDEILEEVDVVHNALTRLEAEGKDNE